MAEALTVTIDAIAQDIVRKWSDATNSKTAFMEKGLEARKYLASTSTATTEVGKLPWKNRTTIPKLTQIADNLHSYYMAAFMPADDWFVWEGSNELAQVKARTIQQYMRAKLRVSKFREALSKLVRDWIIYGNCFGAVTWVEEYTIEPITKNRIPKYIGPKLYRISPYDICINHRAVSFDKSWLIKREVVAVSDLLTDETIPEEIKKALREPRTVANDELVDSYKKAGLEIDGFVDLNTYFDSGYAELLEFWGDLYDPARGEVLQNQQIVIADRSTVILQRTNPSWTGQKPFAHSGWRGQPDNLYAQGPLDQLVGMQYRCDHLENLKADAFDQIIHPMVKIKGDLVDDFEFGPGQRIHCGLDGDVDFLRPDSSVLQADNQIAIYHGLMELMAGSPREMMGFRTPGEKTAFEVQTLQAGADRLFLDKVNHFEETFIEPILNLMFELIIRNLDIVDVVRVFNDETKAEEISRITRDDLAATGVLRPMGGKHYAARNKRVQELSQFLQIVGSNPLFNSHFSAVRAGNMLEEELGFDKWNLFEENIGIKEQINSQVQAALLQQMAQQALGGQQGVAQQVSQNQRG